MSYSSDSICPCHSNQKYKLCCQPFHEGTIPSSSLQLMRSRYSAYALGLCDYIIATTHSSNVDYSLNKKKWKEDIDIFCKQNQFINLQILSHFENDIVGHVKFIATLSSGDLCETSKFIKMNKKWFYQNAVLD